MATYHLRRFAHADGLKAGGLPLHLYAADDCEALIQRGSSPSPSTTCALRARERQVRGGNVERALRRHSTLTHRRRVDAKENRMGEQRAREVKAMATLAGEPAPTLVNTTRGPVEYVACGEGPAGRTIVGTDRYFPP